MIGKDIKSFVPITHIKGSFVHSHENWAILSKDTFTIYMAFKKLLYYIYYLYNGKVIIKCDYAHLCKFLSAHTLNSEWINR